MSSSVFFKFKSQKEPSRVTFDGTGISVFELKREIININKLGDGTDFDLAIYNEDTSEEYEEDTTIIPRSTSVTARRLPPVKPGRGTAQRYVSGKMPTMALNAGRIEKPKAANQSASVKKVESSIPGIGGSQSEEDRIAAMFAASNDQWAQTQEQMATATPIYRGGAPAGGFKKNMQPAPAHPPPNGYVCYRCGEKGHWIQQCPTNADPTFDGRPRVKRTTGIPRSFLKTVDKPVATDDDESGGTNPSAVMVNADGEYVVAIADQASWEKHQQKAAKSSAQATESTAENKEIEDLGLSCPIDHKLFKDATKTPCCSKVYCEECIQSALLDSDFVCPNCDSKDIYLDHLISDTEARKKVDDYASGKLVARAKSKTPEKSPPTGKVALINGNGTMENKTGTPKITLATIGSPSMNPKKRPADDDLAPEIPRGPTAMLRNKSDNSMQRTASAGPEVSTPTSTKTISPTTQPATTAQFNNVNNANGNNNFNTNPNFNNSMNMYPGQQMMPNGMNGFFPDPSFMANGMNPMMMGMNPGMNMMGMPNMGMDMSMMGGYGMGMGVDPMAMMQMQGMNQTGYMQLQQPQYNQQQQNYNGMNMNMNMHTGFQQQQHHQGQFGVFPNQQRTVFSEPFPSEEDSPYMRKPVNPHRHLKMKRPRPSDFKPLTER